MIKRKKDWPRLMAEAIAERRSQPFRWGVNDCGHSAGDIILAITGTDIIAKYRGTYDSELGAHRLFRDNGGIEAVFSGIAAEHDLAEVKPSFAMRGDLALFLSVPCVAIVDGVNSFAPAEDGLRSLRTQTASKVWRVPS